MPLASNRHLRRLFLSGRTACGLPDIDPTSTRSIIRAARGRVGWLTDCMARLQMPHYWSGGRLHVGGLCTDTEMAIRAGGCGPRMSRRAIRAQLGA